MGYTLYMLSWVAVCVICCDVHAYDPVATDAVTATDLTAAVAAVVADTTTDADDADATDVAAAG